MSDIIVSMKALSKSFKDSTVLAPIDQEVRAGEVVSIVGPNGGGKSTLLMLKAGLQKPSGGSVEICGKPAHLIALESAGMVGLVLARPGLYPLLNGRENLDYFGGLFGLSRVEVESKARHLIELFDLGQHMEQRLESWSTGMQQKLSLVRALLLSPKLLLVDEPAANLDPIVARSFYDELRRRADSEVAPLACICVTHDFTAAEAISDRVWIVDSGLKKEIKLTRQPQKQEGPIFAAWRQAIP